MRARAAFTAIRPFNMVPLDAAASIARSALAEKEAAEEEEVSRIDDAFVASVARAWHGIELDAADAQVLARMLAPMDDAGEALASRLAFEREPADFLRAMDWQAQRP